MVLQQVYRKSGESPLVNYDFTDIQEGTGIITIYGAKTQSGYVMIRQSAYSDFILTTGALDADETPAKIDPDFDLILNAPAILKGKLYAVVPANAQNGATGAGISKRVYVIVKVRKWDGTTETEIANGTSPTRIISGSSGEVFDHDIPFLVEVTIPSPVKFSPGDTVRCTVEVYAWQVGGGTMGNYYLMHDPAGRTTSQFQTVYEPSTMIFYIPFKLDL